MVGNSFLSGWYIWNLSLPFPSKIHVFRFCDISVADSSAVHCNISIYEMRFLILAYIEIARHSLAAQKIYKVEPFLAKSLFNM